MARGDDALAGQEEHVPSHPFPPVDYARTIFFKGLYLSIYNQQTDEYETHIDNLVATTEYSNHVVPPGYTTYVRGGTVYFRP
ncbi:hypothetical protein VN97_g6581 [Penicillium thymicola]|uniref:Uncharacterized protein n=1 Tax=Penicillium thymicola TaxID=293382 RepID=A0AAI9TGM2_PENTH|nr:hypothetical protein VN97_g6581 [Penicillium thymicola]